MSQHSQLNTNISLSLLEGSARHGIACDDSTSYHILSGTVQHTCEKSNKLISQSDHVKPVERNVEQGKVAVKGFKENSFGDERVLPLLNCSVQTEQNTE